MQKLCLVEKSVIEGCKEEKSVLQGVTLMIDFAEYWKIFQGSLLILSSENNRRVQVEIITKRILNHSVRRPLSKFK